MNNDLSLIWKALGYRLLAKGTNCWFKPIAYSLLVFNKDRLELLSIGRDEQIMIWSSVEIDCTKEEDDVRNQIIEAECVICSKGVHYRQYSKRFDFLSQEDYLGIIL